MKSTRRRLVLLVIQIEQRGTPSTTPTLTAATSFLIGDFFKMPVETSSAHASRHRQARARDRRRARPAIRLQHIAIDPKRARPEQIQIHHRAQRPPDQPLDFRSAPIEPAFGNVARLYGSRVE